MDFVETVQVVIRRSYHDFLGFANNANQSAQQVSFQRLTSQLGVFVSYNMIPINRRMFDMYSLSLPHGLNFGDSLPIMAFQSDDGTSCGAVLRHVRNRRFGFICLRRRVDYVWTLIGCDYGFLRYRTAKDALARLMRDGLPLELVPSGVRVRPKLYESGSTVVSPMFDFARSRECYAGSWALHEAYLALPNPDANWVSDCQTSNFHARLWEAYLLACFREQGCQVAQDQPSPDFYVSNTSGCEAWIEAVTANAEPFDHSSAKAVETPNLLERQIGSPAVRFARTLRSKLQRKYELLPHVQGIPFAIALSDYHAPGSLVWSRNALPAYLYGVNMVIEEKNGAPVGTIYSHSTLLDVNSIRSGLFLEPENSGISAVIFSNDGSIAKFQRMGFLAGIKQDDVAMVRTGILFSRVPGAAGPTLFEHDIASAEYASIWPPNGETWSMELDVFHNPMAKHPLSFDLLPKCTHWFKQGEEILCRYSNEFSVLGSRTFIE